MAYTCDICSKRRLIGNKVSHSNMKTKTRQQPNLQRIRAKTEQGNRHIRVCTRCLRSGLVQKAS